jgi:hypothetical protein
MSTPCLRGCGRRHRRDTHPAPVLPSDVTAPLLFPTPHFLSHQSSASLGSGVRPDIAAPLLPRDAAATTFSATLVPCPPTSQGAACTRVHVYEEAVLRRRLRATIAGRLGGFFKTGLGRQCLDGGADASKDFCTWMHGLTFEFPSSGAEWPGARVGALVGAHHGSPAVAAFFISEEVKRLFSYSKSTEMRLFPEAQGRLKEYCVKDQQLLQATVGLTPTVGEAFFTAMKVGRDSKQDSATLDLCCISPELSCTERTARNRAFWPPLAQYKTPHRAMPSD